MPVNLPADIFVHPLPVGPPSVVVVPGEVVVHGQTPTPTVLVIGVQQGPAGPSFDGSGYVTDDDPRLTDARPIKPAVYDDPTIILDGGLL